MSSHCLLYYFQWEVSSWSIMSLLYVVSHFSLRAFTILSLVLSLATFCLGLGFFDFILLEACWILCTCNVFQQIWEGFGYYFFNQLFCPFFSLVLWELPLCICWCVFGHHTPNCVSQISAAVYIFLVFFCYSDWVTSIDLSWGSLSVLRNEVTHGRTRLKTSRYLTRRRQWHPTPVLLPGESHGRRSLVGC